MAIRTSKRPARPTEVTSPAGPSHEQIAARAYARYEERGGADGSDLEDWLEAERELGGQDRHPPASRDGDDDAFAVSA